MLDKYILLVQLLNLERAKLILFVKIEHLPSPKESRILPLWTRSHSVLWRNGHVSGLRDTRYYTYFVKYQNMCGMLRMKLLFKAKAISS